MEENKIFQKVFMWMFVGLFISFLTGSFVASNPNMIYNIYTGGLYWWFIIAEFALVVYLSARINKMSYNSAVISYLLYSFVSGLTISVIFVAFEFASIIMVFGLTSLVFLVFSLIGYFTKIDLTKFGTILMMGLLAIIVASIINIFISSYQLDLVTTIIAIVIFMGFIMYDIQKIKRMSLVITDPNKAAIIGALQLYLDFINLFIRLLRLFGRNRD
jgi:FtsH-binding integral membrane protein